MAHQENDLSEWTNCQPGTLQSLSERLRAADVQAGRNRTVSGVSAASLAVVTLVVVGFFVARSPAVEERGLTCRQCAAQFDKYHQHLALDAGVVLAPELAAKVQEHLAHCEFCRHAFENRFREELEASDCDRCATKLAKLDSMKRRRAGCCSVPAALLSVSPVSAP